MFESIRFARNTPQLLNCTTEPHGHTTKMLPYVFMPLQSIKSALRRANEYYSLPKFAQQETRRDQQGLPQDDPGSQTAIDYSLQWLCVAQDKSASHDGGVARHYSWVDGWSTSYPETTGYIVPTILEHGAKRQDRDLIDRGRRMLDWLVKIQLPGGGFQGGVIGSTPVIPVTFNTGQILMGLAAGVRVFGDAYLAPMQSAADWLVDTQDADGCWRKHGTPFAAPGEKAYETHVAWGLLEAARVRPDKGYADAALRNMRWAVEQQQSNGWFRKNCLTDPVKPLTHTIGYVLRGLVEGYRFSREAWLLEASMKTAEALLTCIRDDGYIPGRLDQNWRTTVDFACLTGIVQISACWLLLDAELNRPDFREAAYRANQYVRRTLKTSGSPDIVGGVKGSFPVSGDYGKYQLLNWAAKFSIDANALEITSRERSTGQV
jgi:hypothetical protein